MKEFWDVDKFPVEILRLVSIQMCYVKILGTVSSLIINCFTIKWTGGVCLCLVSEVHHSNDVKCCILL